MLAVCCDRWMLDNCLPLTPAMPFLCLCCHPRLQELLSEVTSHMSAHLHAYKVNEVAVGLWAVARLKGQPGLRLMAAALQHCFSQVSASREELGAMDWVPWALCSSSPFYTFLYLSDCPEICVCIMRCQEANAGSFRSRCVCGRVHPSLCLSAGSPADAQGPLHADVDCRQHVDTAPESLGGQAAGCNTGERGVQHNTTVCVWSTSMKALDDVCIVCLHGKIQTAFSLA